LRGFGGLDELVLFRRALVRAKQENLFLREHILLLAAEVRGWGHVSGGVCDMIQRCALCEAADKLEAMLK